MKTIAFMMFSLILSLPVSSLADKDDAARTWHLSANNVTGPNDVCGAPVLKAPSPFPPDLHIALVGEYDSRPGAVNVIPLSPDHCDENIVLASYVNPAFLASGGFPDADQRLKNVPLRDLPVIAGPDGVRSVLPGPGTTPEAPIFPSKGEPDAPITLGQWLKAGGDMTIRCYKDGSAKINAHFSNLISNGLYTVFGIWNEPLALGAGVPSFIPSPMGGVPNAFVANRRGQAEFERDLSFCPKDTAPDGSSILFIAVAYNADGSTNGAVPFTPFAKLKFRSSDGSIFESTMPPGTASFTQLSFAITMLPLH